MKTSLQWKNPRQAAMDPEAVLAELAQELSQQASDEVDEYIKQWHESGLKAFQKTSGAGATSVGERKSAVKTQEKEENGHKVQTSQPVKVSTPIPDWEVAGSAKVFCGGT